MATSAHYWSGRLVFMAKPVMAIFTRPMEGVSQENRFPGSTAYIKGMAFFAFSGIISFTRIPIMMTGQTGQFIINVMFSVGERYWSENSVFMVRTMLIAVSFSEILCYCVVFFSLAVS